MSFRIIDSGWDKELCEALRADSSRVRIVCPFIKKGAAERLLKLGKAKALQVITRFNLDDFSEGASDIDALQLLLDKGAQIRGVRNLHAKLYLFGANRAIVTSANLTDAGLLRNHEFGFVSEDAPIVARCHQYFDDLWARAGRDLSIARLTEWERKVTTDLTNGTRRAPRRSLGDHGVDAEISIKGTALPAPDGGSEQAFVKFFGTASDRAVRATPILESVRGSGCHWACTYPKGKRPRRVRDGAVMFIGALAKEPNDILIYGRAVGTRHEPGRDDASPADLQLRPWKKKWPHYVRVNYAEFVAGILANGVSLNEMMAALKSDAFMSTQRKAENGQASPNPRRAYAQQAAVELSNQGMKWLEARLLRAFVSHGKLSSASLEQLDWPVIPTQAAGN